MLENAIKTPLPFASVIVPALNCADDVQGFADAMKRQDYPADRFEAIVVDNGSSDDTFERARSAGLITLQRKEKGRARALNTGVEAAQGEIILTTDMSCRAEPNWIRTVVETFAAYPAAGCVAGEIRLLKTHDNAVIRFQERTNYMSPLLALNRVHFPYLPFADGANASFRKCVLDEIGGFEESFVKAADVEVCYRMFVLTDYLLVFNRAALMWEPGEASLRALLHQRFRIGLGSNLLRMKYPALHGVLPSGFSLRRTYWRLRHNFITSLHLLALNSCALLGYKQEVATDANIRQLMSWLDWYGSHYGRWWLEQQGIRPKPVDEARLHQFMERPEQVRERVILVESLNGRST